VEYDICLKLSAASARKLGRAYSKPLTLIPEMHPESGRWDLRVDLARGSGNGQQHLHYHRLIGLALLETGHSKAGRKRVVPVVVAPGDWGCYEVHHVNWNNLDCRLCNLEAMQKDRHRGGGRDGWSKKVLSHAQKVLMMSQPRTAKRPAKRPACSCL
jgi:hypothetical protein